MVINNTCAFPAMTCLVCRDFFCVNLAQHLSIAVVRGPTKGLMINDNLMILNYNIWAIKKPLLYVGIIST